MGPKSLQVSGQGRVLRAEPAAGGPGSYLPTSQGAERQSPRGGLPGLGGAEVGSPAAPRRARLCPRAGSPGLTALPSDLSCSPQPKEAGPGTTVPARPVACRIASGSPRDLHVPVLHGEMGMPQTPSNATGECHVSSAQQSETRSGNVKLPADATCYRCSPSSTRSPGVPRHRLARHEHSPPFPSMDPLGDPGTTAVSWCSLDLKMPFLRCFPGCQILQVRVPHLVQGYSQCLYLRLVRKRH